MKMRMRRYRDEKSHNLEKLEDRRQGRKNKSPTNLNNGKSILLW